MCFHTTGSIKRRYFFWFVGQEKERERKKYFFVFLWREINFTSFIFSYGNVSILWSKSVVIILHPLLLNKTKKIGWRRFFPSSCCKNRLKKKGWESMLRQTWRKRHLISSPPQKGLFWEYFHELLGLGHKKKFWKDFGANPMFWNNYRPLPAILWFWEIQKIWDFQYFWTNLATVFFQNTILDQISSRIIKNDFSDIL